MAEIQVELRIAYRSPTRRRSYFTVHAAARQEAAAMIRRKYPTERDDQDGGGWHWSSDGRLQRVHQRLTRLLLRKFAQ